MSVEQRDNVNFARYRTFDFADTEVKTNGNRNLLLHSPIAQDHIKQAIASEMAECGLREVASSPDLLITPYLRGADRAHGIRHVCRRQLRLPLRRGLPGRFSAHQLRLLVYTRPVYSQPRIQQYRAGTLIIEFIDRRTNNLGWRGSMADDVNDPARLGAEFSKLAKDILDKFSIDKKNPLMPPG